MLPDQASGLVPIVEPEVLLDGEHDIDRTLEVAEAIWAETFKYLADNKVRALPVLAGAGAMRGATSNARRLSDDVTWGTVCRGLHCKDSCLNLGPLGGGTVHGRMRGAQGCRPAGQLQGGTGCERVQTAGAARAGAVRGHPAEAEHGDAGRGLAQAREARGRRRLHPQAPQAPRATGRPGCAARPFHEVVSVMPTLIPRLLLKLGEVVPRQDAVSRQLPLSTHSAGMLRLPRS